MHAEAQAPAPRARLLLRVRVDLGPGEARMIEVREGDDPAALAAAFCAREKVPSLLAPKLAAEIDAQLAAILLRRARAAAQEDDDLAHRGTTKVNGRRASAADRPPSPPPSPPPPPPPPPPAVLAPGPRPAALGDAGSGPGSATAATSPSPSLRGAAASSTTATSTTEEEKTSGETTGQHKELSPESRRRAYYDKLQEQYCAKTQRLGEKSKRKAAVRRNNNHHNHGAGGGLGALGQASLSSRVSNGSGASSQGSSCSSRSRKSLTREEAEAAGRRLYTQGLKVKARVARELEEAKQEKDREELRACTFQPNISSYARTLHGGRTHGEGLELEVRKFQEAKLAREQMRQVRALQEVEEACSFKPVISKRSEELAAETRRRAESELRNANLHEGLFQEAAQRQAERLRLESQPLYSFKPEVHAHSQASTSAPEGSMSAAAPGASSGESGKAFIERLAAPRTDRERAADLAPQIDLSTGRELFKPQIGRAPKEPWARPAGVPISDYLFYSRHQFRDIRDQLRQDEDAAAREIQERGTMSKASRRIAEQIRADRFGLLWKSLRDDTLLAPSSQGEPVPTADEIEERRLRVLVELLPELLLRHIGPDDIIAASYLEEQDFTSFLMRASRGIPCTSDLLLS